MVVAAVRHDPFLGAALTLSVLITEKQHTLVDT